MDPGKGQPPKSPSERWQGKFIDHNGRIGTLEVDVDPSGRSSWTLKLVERDGHAAELKGETDVKYDEKTGMRMKATHQSRDGQKISWETDLRPAEAGPYAEKALSGQYLVSAAPGQHPLSGGVMILWKFK